jgi:hypothetical protein
VSLSLQISGLFFLTCIVLAMLSEYLLQVLEMTKGGPRYHIAHQAHSSTLSMANPLNVVDTREIRSLQNAERSDDDPVAS